MAYVYRLIFFALLSFLASSAFSAVPTVSGYRIQTGGEIYPSTSSACAAALQLRQKDTSMSYKLLGITPISGGARCIIEQCVLDGSRCFGDAMSLNAVEVPGQCPSNSSLQGGQCVCSNGFVESGGQCKTPKDDACSSLSGMGTGISSLEGDYGPQSTAWAAAKIGKQGNACMAGCQVSGTVNGCVGGSGNSGSMVCMISGSSFTGNACSDTAAGGSDGDGDPGNKPNDCPAGYEPSKYVPGICIPRENSCPAGYSPSAYVAGVCIPNESKNDGKCEDPSDPLKRVECEGKKNNCPTGQVQSTTQVGACVPGKDGSGKDGNGNPVVCVGGTCTSKKPDGTEEKKPQSEYCKENPNAEVCKENKGSFAGACAGSTGSFTCEGDALMCAVAKEQYTRNCQFFEDRTTAEYQLWSAEKDKTGSVLSRLPGNQEIDISSKVSAQDTFIGAGSCPADRAFNFGYGSVTIPYSRLCPFLEIMGNVIVICASLAGARIIIRRS